MLIGITGMIGSGKSSLAEMFNENGWYLINADKIGNEVVKKNSSLLNKLAREFGSDILTPTKRLRRKHLAKKAFVDQTTVNKLNTLVHPYLLKELDRQVNHHIKYKRKIIIDAALLLNWNYDKKVDYVITVHASLENRIKRMKTRGFTSDDIKRITDRQLRFNEFRKRSDFIIYNNGARKELRKKFNDLIKKIS